MTLKALGRCVPGCSQTVLGDGTAIGTVLSGGTQHVAGRTFSTAVRAGGSEIVKGSAWSSVIYGSGVQSIARGGSAMNTLIQGGVQDVAGTTLSTFLSAGRQNVQNGGTASATTAAGGQIHVTAGGLLREVTISSRGRLYISSGASVSGAIVFSGGENRVSAGGIASATSVAGNQLVWGSALDAKVKNGGSQVVKGGLVQGTQVSSGGSLTVYKGVASSISLLVGGRAEMAPGATLRTAAVSSAGSLFICSGAKVSDITLKAGSKLTIVNGNTLAGKNSFTGAFVTGSGACKCLCEQTRPVKLAKDGSLFLGAGNSMKGFYLDASSAGLSCTGPGTTIGSLKLNAATKVVFDIGK